MIKKIVFSVVSIYVCACEVNSEKNPQPRQTIINYNTSITTGNLQVVVFDKSSNKVFNASVFLYLNYDDIKRNLYVWYLKSSNKGLADFGYINTGN